MRIPLDLPCGGLEVKMHTEVENGSAIRSRNSSPELVCFCLVERPMIACGSGGTAMQKKTTGTGKERCALANYNALATDVKMEMSKRSEMPKRLEITSSPGTRKTAGMISDGLLC